MSIFKLEPIPENLDDALWERSEPPHEACYVSAPNEVEARMHAYNRFHQLERKAIDLGLDRSPWGSLELVSCTEIMNFGDDMPEGMVYRVSEAAPGK
jgi:hypothetical protein